MPFSVAGAVSGPVRGEVKDDSDVIHVFANPETLLAHSMLAINLL